MNDHSDTDDPNDDGEGVWSPDIEQCFREALIMFPACGRRKHILQGEGGGKMYGRNELIARHIMMRTGKIRTRKQVSSHIQVLARRKAKAEASSGGGIAGSMSPASSMGDGGNRLGRPESTASGVGGGGQHHQLISQQQQQTANSYYDVWNDRPIVTQKIRLVEFSAFIEYRQTNGGGLLSTPFANQPQATPASAPLNGLTGLASVAVASSASIVPMDQQHAVVQSHEPIANAQTNQQPVHQMPAFAIGAGVITGPQNAQIVGPQPQPNSSHPLASNHQLPTQFNQANNYANGNSMNNNHHHHQSNPNQPLNNNHQHHLNQQQHQQGTDLLPAGMAINMNGNQLISSQHQQQLQSSTGFTRHSYIKIDYRRPMMAHINKLERIDISQINDKFPEIGGPDGLFQRGPADAFFLVKFWADLNNDYEYNIEDQNSYFGFSSHFETIDPYKDITCSTKACSYGRPMVEKVEKIYGAFNNLDGRYSYDINRSPMCEFMIQFIKKLRKLSRASQMNSVLENFTVLQVVTSESTSEILLCLAYVFEIASPEQNRGGSQYRVYKLTKD